MTRRAHAKRETRYVSIVTVYVGHGSDVLDCMRYDSCFPLTEADAHVAGSEWRSDNDRILRLMRASRSDAPVNDARWKSFGCVVLDERPADAAPLSDEEAQGRVRFMLARGSR